MFMPLLQKKLMNLPSSSFPQQHTITQPIIMLLHAPTTNSSLVFITKHNTKNTLALLTIPTSSSSSSSCTPLRSNPPSTSAITTTLLAAAASACLVLTAVVGAGASVGLAPSDPPEEETLSNVPQTLSGECLEAKDCKKARIQRPKSRKAETCTVKCVTTCIRGGDGSPGEGPLNIRRPLVVFKPGFRTRQYCLVECSEICNLIGDKDDGP